jgi:uncharacterized protein YecE (DUF72 family)
MPARIHIGTSSWADADLIESGFYPAELKDTPSKLGYFAERFSLAEVDSTYYAMPSRKNIERWAAAVPDGFCFSVKAFALFTQHPTRLSSIPKSFHEQLPEDVLKKSRVYHKDVPEDVTEQLWKIFRNALTSMREQGKLGSVLIDFPPWWGPSTANREYLRDACAHLPDDNVIVEFRNRRWVDDEETRTSTFALLRDLDAGFVCVDEPPGLDSAMPPVAAVTGSVSAVRFRGRNAARWDDKKATPEEKFDWLYSEKELGEWLPRVEALARDADRVFLGFNTKSADQSVVNADLFRRMLRLERG